MYSKEEEKVKNDVLKNVSKNMILEHQGDLTIEGDVEENAQIKVNNGSLIIFGNVKEGVRINMIVFEKLRNSVSDTSEIISRLSMQGIRIGGGSFKSYNSRKGNCLIGNVNIDGRIFTNDQLTELGGKKYKITANSERKAGKIKSGKGLASATIDGVKYEGKEISIDGSVVRVDGHLQRSSSLNTPKTTKLLIHGDVGHHVQIDSDASMEVKGNIGNFCLIQSHHTGLLANNIGEETRINVLKKISVANVEKYCVLTSKKDGVEAKNIKGNVKIDVRNTVTINGDIGKGCEITSHKDGLTANNIGEYVVIKVKDSIRVHDIGSHSLLTSTKYGLEGNEVGNNVQLRAHDAIELSSVGDDCSIESSTNGVVINNNVGGNTKISSDRGIKIMGHSGDNVTLKAKGPIQAKNVGNNATVISAEGKVSLRNVGSKSIITACNDIDIDGSCPANVTMQTQRGMIRKTSSNNFANIHTGGSLSTELNRQGLFSKPDQKKEARSVDVEIPQCYLCIITKDIMVNPLLCSLDGISYEASAIKKWLQQYRTSPYTRLPMEPEQTIDEVLTKNRNLEDAIEIFRNANPQLFAGNSNSL